MIPIRVTVDGFLSYRNKETFDFSDRSLWMLSGDNGAGKSALFDTITFALFKKNRQGKSQNVEDMINWYRDNFKVIFEFQVGTETYKAERTVEKKGSKTCRLDHRNGDEWVPVPDTANDDGFSREIDKLLGMTYETFTSSAILRQGKVDQLLEVAPRDRSTLLSQIVGDLSAYEDLYNKAKVRQAEYKMKADDAGQRLSEMPSVKQAEIDDAQKAASNAEAAEQTAQKSVTTLAALAIQAAQWEDHTSECSALAKRIATADELIAIGPAIRIDVVRCEDLSHAIPLLRDLRDAQKRLQAAMADDERARGAVTKAIQANTQCYGLPPSASIDEQSAWLEERMAEQISSLDEAKSCLPHLTTLARKRNDTVRALGRIQDLRSDKRNSATVPDTEEQACAEEIAAYALAETASGTATEQLTQRQYILQDIEQRLGRMLPSADGDDPASFPVCDYCGQPLSAARLAEHRATLSATRDRARQHESEAVYQKSECDTNLVAARNALRAARLAWQENVKVHQKREAEIAHQMQVLLASWNEAKVAAMQLTSELYRGKALDLFPDKVDPERIATTVWSNDPLCFPTEVDLQELREQAQLVSQIRSVASDFRDLRQSMDFSGRVLVGRLEDEARAASKVPGNWLIWYKEATSADSLEGLEIELANLDGALDKQKMLDEAVRNRKTWQETMQRHQESIEQLPELARRPSVDVRQQANEAQANLANAKTALRTAETVVAGLERSKEDRETTEQIRKRYRRQDEVYKELARLLGRDGLQRYLLGGAEEAITAYANEALFGFSHGTLRLEPRPGRAGRGGKDEAFDLLCVNTESSGDAGTLPLANLSGSQKFRVAVSIALGIGRFASRNDARIESVIIDEGFGSLDRRNQQDMADAIRSLADNHALKRIIVVSHQEAFAERFTDRIHVALGPNGSHRVEVPSLL